MRGKEFTHPTGVLFNVTFFSNAGKVFEQVRKPGLTDLNKHVQTCPVRAAGQESLGPCSSCLGRLICLIAVGHFVYFSSTGES